MRRKSKLPTTRKTPGSDHVGPRGVLSCKADGKGGQTIEDTGPLTKKRMETIDKGVQDRAMAWMEGRPRPTSSSSSSTRRPCTSGRTSPRKIFRARAARIRTSDRMVVHDEQIGMMLDKLDELGIADNTIVMYSTDNGPENDTWPDGATTPFRGQKD